MKTYNIDRSKSGTLTVATSSDTFVIALPDNCPDIVECCVTSITQIDSSTYLQTTDTNGIETNLTFSAHDLDSQNPLINGTIELDTDYLYIKFRDTENLGMFTPVYIKLPESSNSEPSE